MISLRRMIIVRSMVRCPALFTKPAFIQRHQSKSSVDLTITRTFSIGERRKIDNRHIADFDEVKKSIQQPNRVIIDVRDPDEVNSTGKIPSSINIPLDHVENVLTSMSEAEFQKYYQRNKPHPTNELIFYCRSGRRASLALHTALRLGYTNSKTYMGSWEDWSNRTSAKKTFMGSWGAWSNKTQGR